MPSPTDPHTFRTGRFECHLSADGRKLTVRDLTVAGQPTITAKLTEWSELTEAMKAALVSRFPEAFVKGGNGGNGRG